MSSSISLTRREQLEKLLDNLVDATYVRLGARKKAEAALKATSFWKRREAARAKAEKIVKKANKQLKAIEKALISVAESLGPIKQDEDYDADNDNRTDLAAGVNITIPSIKNPIESLAITERDGKLILHSGNEGQWEYRHRHHSEYIEKPKGVFAEATIGSPELLALVAELKAEFTAGLSEKDLIAVLARAKEELGKLK